MLQGIIALIASRGLDLSKKFKKATEIDRGDQSNAHTEQVYHCINCERRAKNTGNYGKSLSKTLEARIHAYQCGKDVIMPIHEQGLIFRQPAVGKIGNRDTYFCD